MVDIGPVSWERMIGAVEKVRDRLLRATAALERAGVPYAVAGGNAVAAWVSRVDEAAVRNTQDVDILLRRADLEAAKQALEAAGFSYRHSSSIDMFLDGPGAKAQRSACRFRCGKGPARVRGAGTRCYGLRTRCEIPRAVVAGASNDEIDIIPAKRTASICST